MLPAVSAIVAAPQAAIVGGEDGLGVGGVDPDVVEIAVGAALDGAEAAPAIGGEKERSAGLEDFVFVFRIDDQIREVEGAPDLELAGIEFRPGAAGIVGAEEGALFGLDGGVARC